jgi:hypothetical protein
VTFHRHFGDLIASYFSPRASLPCVESTAQAAADACSSETVIRLRQENTDLRKLVKLYEEAEPGPEGLGGAELQAGATGAVVERHVRRSSVRITSVTAFGVRAPGRRHAAARCVGDSGRILNAHPAVPVQRRLMSASSTAARVIVAKPTRVSLIPYGSHSRPACTRPPQEYRTLGT